jgi:hypothetical protein
VPANDRRAQFRNLAIAILAPFLLALLWMPLPRAHAAPSLQVLTATPIVLASSTTTRVQFRLTNDTAASITYALTTTSSPTGITATFPEGQTQVVPGNQSRDFSIDFTAPAFGGSFTVTVQASGSGSTLSQAVQFTVTGPTVTPTISATGPLGLAPVTQTVTANQGQTVTANLTLTNNTGARRTFRFSATSVPVGVRVRFPINDISVASGGTFQFPVLVEVTTSSGTGQNYGTIQIRAVAVEDPTSFSADAFLFLNVTATTVTPQPGCPEATPAPGGDRGGALLILVDVEQRYGICRQGEEDWFKFAALGGKVYTLDILQMDLGLDLSLELYDEDGVRLTSNDDFFARTPPPAPTPPRDIRPRIQSWRAPDNGIYYVRVRDAANIGGGNRSYIFIINSESYGPTPPTVTEICRDLFEEDGLPEEAKLITSNEIQPRRVLCPTGDADWVRFFGKTGKTYYLYTDTRNYANNPDFNNQTQAGADTTIFLMDRDGQTLLDFNDDIEGSLDSQIRFVPQVDGFYFLQIKNTGDIGNQFIRYDLVLEQCVPDTECGRAPQPVVVPPAGGGTGGGSGGGSAPTAAPTNTTVVFDTTQTPSPTTTATVQAFAAQGDAQPAPLIDGELRGFADTTFEQVWQRNDRIVAEGRATRGWLWGPRTLMARAETYAQAAGGMRQVQYFDKGRMEINNPGGDRSARWFVTSGLLVMELVTGRAQIGDNEYTQRGAAQVPVAGDGDDGGAPTYASFGVVAMQSAPNRVGQAPRETIDRAGQVGTYGGPQRPETRIAHYVPESGHNVPAVFWEFLNAQGTVYEGGRAQRGLLIDWLFTLGYPVSEPYWTRVKVGGVERDVLVQLYQRRVLTYMPDNPRGWRVEMGNVGRHYYRWRYGAELP